MTDEITIRKSTYNRILAGIVVMAVVLSFTLGFMVGNGGKATVTGALVAAQQQPLVQQPGAPSRVQVSADDDPAIGDAGAKVTIIEFSDFQCPFCGRFYEQTLPQIKDNYVKTGKARLVYRDFPLDSIHPEAIPGALAAGCANEQGKFWEYHDKIFGNQQSMNGASYKAWAAELGLNTEQFSQCYDSKKYQSEVEKDFNDGTAAGVSGTPTFYIGSPQKGYQEIVGAQPYSVIKQAIDQELAG